jgi:hypothetical protein
MQRNRISQLIQMRSIGISDTRRRIEPAIPGKWHIVGPTACDLGRMTCRQRNKMLALREAFIVLECLISQLRVRTWLRVQ